MGVPLLAGPGYLDRTHPSRVFREDRHYRIFLPPGYGEGTERYPVIYYFHGHSDRYTLERYDQGKDTVPKIAAFVAGHPVIVVAADGYVARDYTAFYGGTPYDVRREGGQYDYGEYFRELMAHVDATYRTLAGRRYRATSGLSMGGFMSLYLSARYPELVGSASAFNPGPEFYVGEAGRRSLWRPKDHVGNHEKTMVRLIRASGDYISQYHEELRAAYAVSKVDFEYRQDEYHRHWATSIGETFAFHERAFGNAGLETRPEDWNYTSAQKGFEVRDYRVAADLEGPAVVSLENVGQGGFRVRTRRWAPDGPAASCRSLTVQTEPVYRPGASYGVLDHEWKRGTTKKTEAVADSAGRLKVTTDCGGHEISFGGPGTGAQTPVLLPVTERDVLRVMPGRAMTLPVRIYNPRATAADGVRVELRSEYPTVEVLEGKVEAGKIEAGGVADLSERFRVRFTAGAGDFAHARLGLKMIYDGYHEKTAVVDVLIAPEGMPDAGEVEILDGRTRVFPVFRQKGNQGGGQSVERPVAEGKGNGNGILEPGEEATIWLRLKQGLDPFDKNNWCRAKVYVDSPYMEEAADIQEDKQREWTSAQSRTSVVRLEKEVPGGVEIPMILDCESWSFSYTPDVRYGSEPLYQAFQFHQHHLFGWKWKATRKPEQEREKGKE